MTGWILIVDGSQGQEALIFKSQAEADAWEDRHPGVSDYVQGGIPVTSKVAVAREAHKQPGDHD